MKKLVLCIMAALMCASACAEEFTGARIHVIGRTDLREDQQFKLIVRDAALEYIVKSCSDADDDAIFGLICENSAAIEDNLNELCARLHQPEDISVETGIFPYAASDEYPAGDYPAIRIRIGGGEGRNWWSMLNDALRGREDEDVIYHSAIVDWLMRIFGLCSDT